MKQELEQAAKDYAEINDNSSITNGFSIVKFAAFKAGAEWMKKQGILNEEVTFGCINKYVTMTVQQLIDYYIDTECAECADECGF